MIPNRLRNNRGLTFPEMMTVCVLLSMVLLGTLAVLIGSLDYWCEGVSASVAGSGAGLAVQKLVRDIEEGSSASVVSGRLVVTYPTYNATNDYYARGTTAYTQTYYLSGTLGTESSGTNLWRSRSTGGTTLIMSDVSAVSYTVTGSRYVAMTLTGRYQEGMDVNTRIIRTSVRLRN